MSRHGITRAGQLFSGSANLSGYQGDKNGIELTPMYLWRPVCGAKYGARAGTFSGVLAAGVTTATLSGNWAGASGLYLMTLSSGQVVMALLTNGATTCLFYPAGPPLTGGSYGPPQQVTNAVTAAFTVEGQPPLLGVANALSTTAAVLLGVSAAFSGVNGIANYVDPLSGLTVSAGVMDVPRNVIAAWTGTAILTVTGYDQYGQLQTEVSGSGTSFTGKKAFAAIISAVPSANTTGMTVGTGNVLGLPFRIESGNLVQAMFNDAADAGTLVLPDLTQPATNATGDVRGTYAAAGTLNGAKFLSILLKVRARTNTVEAFGQTPA